MQEDDEFEFLHGARASDDPRKLGAQIDVTRALIAAG